MSNFIARGKSLIQNRFGAGPLWRMWAVSRWGAPPWMLAFMPAISLMPNGCCLSPLFPAATRPGGGRPIPYAASSMQSFTCCGQEPSGECCRTSTSCAPVELHYALGPNPGLLGESFLKKGKEPLPVPLGACGIKHSVVGHSPTMSHANVVLNDMVNLGRPQSLSQSA